MKFVLFLALLVSFNYAQSDVNGIDSDSGIEGPAYANIEQELVNLQNEYPALAQRIIYGKSVKGLNLNVIKLQKQSNRRSIGRVKAVVISGSTHGNEYLNIEDRLPRAFLTSSNFQSKVREFLEKGNIIYIAPIFNPDGYTADERENARGKDLNRDFPLVREKKGGGFTQPETREFTDFLKRDLPKSNAQLVFSMDYHCCIGAFLHPWSDSFDVIPKRDLDRYNAVRDILMKPFGGQYQVGTTPTLLGYLAPGTSKDYYYVEHGSLSYTMEGEFKEEKNKLPQHIEMWERIFEYLLSAR